MHGMTCLFAKHMLLTLMKRVVKKAFVEVKVKVKFITKCMVIVVVGVYFITFESVGNESRWREEISGTSSL